MPASDKVQERPAEEADAADIESRVLALLADGARADAFAAAVEGVSRHPRNAVLHDLKAAVCAYVGRLEDAESSYKAASALAKDAVSLRTCRALAAAYAHHARHADALAVCRDGLDRFPDDWALQENLAAAWARSGRLGEALQALEGARTSKKGPVSPWVYQAIADLMVSQYLYNEATSLIEQACREDPGSPDLAALEAFLLCINGRFAKGIAQYLRHSPSAYAQPAWRFMSVVAASIQRRDFASAREVARIAESKLSGDPEITASRLACLLHDGRFDEAVDQYGLTANAAAGTTGVWRALRSLVLQGRNRKAWMSRLREFYGAAVKRAPAPDALEASFCLAFDAGEYEEAARLQAPLAAGGANLGAAVTMRYRYLPGLVTGHGDPQLANALRRMDLESLDYAVKVSHRHRIVYVSNPKAASSSIRSALAALEIGAAEYAGQPHANDGAVLVPLRDVASDRPFQHLREQGYRFFTFVRHPLGRAMSCYRNKFMRWPPVDYFVAALLDKDEDWPQEAISFEWFAEHVLRQPYDEMDPHWARQVDQTMAEILDFDFVGRVENLAEDLARLMDLLQVDPSRRPSLPMLNATTDERSMEEAHPTGRLAGALRAKYAADFERFGYR